MRRVPREMKRRGRVRPHLPLVEYGVAPGVPLSRGHEVRVSEDCPLHRPQLGRPGHRPYTRLGSPFRRMAPGAHLAESTCKEVVMADDRCKHELLPGECAYCVGAA